MPNTQQSNTDGSVEHIQRFTDRKSFLAWLQPILESAQRVGAPTLCLWYWFDFRGWVLHAAVRSKDRSLAGYRMAQLPSNPDAATDFWSRTIEEYSTIYLISERARHRLCIAIRNGIWRAFPDEYLGWPKSDLREITDKQLREIMSADIFADVLEEAQEFGVSVRLLSVADSAGPDTSELREPNIEKTQS